MKLVYWSKGRKERVYINRSGGCDLTFSVHLWVEPFPQDPLADWRFEILFRDAESERRRAEIKEEYQTFIESELPLHLHALEPVRHLEQMTWADWVELGSRRRSYRQARH